MILQQGKWTAAPVLVLDVPVVPLTMPVWLPVLLGVVALSFMALPDVELLLDGVDDAHDCLLAGLLSVCS